MGKMRGLVGRAKSAFWPRFGGVGWLGGANGQPNELQGVNLENRQCGWRS
jgi:hypothetical protein